MSQCGRSLDYGAESLGPRVIPRQTRKSAEIGPAAISIHNNRDVQSTLLHKVYRQNFFSAGE